MRFVDSQRGTIIQAGAIQFLGHALVIQGMPAFVSAAEEHCIEKVRIHAGGNSHVIDPETGGERMCSLILPAVFPVITETCDDFFPETPLAGFVERLVEKDILHLWLRRNGFYELHLFRTQAFEDNLHIRSLHARLEIIQQGIVGMVETREKARILLPQGDNFLQVRLENGEIRILAGLQPDLLGQRGHLGKFNDIAGGNPYGFIVVTRSHFKQPGIIRIGVEAGCIGFEFFQQFPQFRGSTALVRQTTEQGQLIAASFRPTRRHIGLLVPAQQRRGIV